jgi:hypothetical protein
MTQCCVISRLEDVHACPMPYLLACILGQSHGEVTSWKNDMFQRFLEPSRHHAEYCNALYSPGRELSFLTWFVWIRSLQLQAAAVRD